MRSSSTAAAALLLAAVTVSGAHAHADVADEPATPVGCVSNADYARLSVGQSLSAIRAIAGDDAQLSVRNWMSGTNSYQERLYAMCTPTDRAHDVLTTRFKRYRCVWRAEIVDTLVGPEPGRVPTRDH
jgi:hypothetical protein